MARKLPRCAKCGESLARSYRMTLEYGKLPGRPMIGWHNECLGRDKRMWGKFCGDLKKDGPQEDAMTLLMKIKARGEDRVAAVGDWQT